MVTKFGVDVNATAQAAWEWGVADSYIHAEFEEPAEFIVGEQTLSVLRGERATP